MNSLTLKPKKLKRKDKDSCTKRKYKRYDRYFFKRDVLSIKDRPLSPLEETVLRHCQYALDSETKTEKRRLKGTGFVYFYKPLKTFVADLKVQLKVETSKSSVHRALTRIEALGFIRSGTYNEKRYAKHGGRLLKEQDLTKSYTVTPKGRKYLKKLAYLKWLKSSGKTMSKFYISDKTPSSPHDKEFKENSTAAQGSTLEMKFLRRELPETEAEVYFHYKLGAAIPKPLKTALWKEYKAEDHKLQSKGSRVRDPIAWARSKHHYNWPERSRKANEQYAKSKEVEDRLLAKERMLRGRGGSDCNFAEGCENVMYNAQVKMNYGPMDQEQTYVPIKKQTPPKPVCEYYEGYSVAINNMIPMIRSGDETSIDAMVSCECWCLEDLEVARELCRKMA